MARSARRLTDISQPLRLHEGSVRPDWIDYNNHLTESRYLQVFGDATDALTSYLGVDGAYRASTGSYFTVETHISHLREIACLEPFYVTTQILHADQKRIHLFHRMHHARTRAFGDRRADAPPRRCRERPSVARKPEVAARLVALRDAQAGLPAPEQAGRAIQKRK